MRAAGVTLFALLAVAAVVPAREPTKQELLVAVEKQLRAANETAGPAVACVVVSKSDRYPKPAAATDAPGKLGGFDSKEFIKADPTPAAARLAEALDLSDPKSVPDHGYACGVVIDPSGLVLTPYHVVEGATKVFVHLPGRVGSYADVHAADARHDLAVLKLIAPPQGLTAIKFADVRADDRNGQRATVFRGKLVVLMANAYVTGSAPDRPSAALGSVTGFRTPEGTPAMKERPSDSYYFFGPLLEHDALLLHDAQLTAGVDGAALLNLDGEFVGLTTSAAAVPGGARGPHYAFPADDNFRRVVDVLRRGEEVEYGYLGVIGPNGGPNGVRFGSVQAQGPAARAGLDEHDVVTQVNGHPTNTYQALLFRVGSALAGERVKLTVRRDGRVREVDVTLGKLKNDQAVVASVRPDPVFGLRVDYSSLLAQKTMGDARLLSNGVPPGVCVRDLTANAPAAAAFKKLGDDPTRWLITHINGAAVGTPAEFYKAAKGQPSVKLTVKDPTELNGRDREVTLP